MFAAVPECRACALIEYSIILSSVRGNEVSILAWCLVGSCIYSGLVPNWELHMQAAGAAAGAAVADQDGDGASRCARSPTMTASQHIANLHDVSQPPARQYQQ